MPAVPLGHGLKLALLIFDGLLYCGDAEVKSDAFGHDTIIACLYTTNKYFLYRSEQGLDSPDFCGSQVGVPVGFSVWVSRLWSDRRYTENAIYVLFAATGFRLGAFASVTWLRRGHGEGVQARHNPP